MAMNAEARYLLRGRMFGASVEALEEFITFCAITLEGGKKDRVKAIQAIDGWLEDQSKESDGGVIGYQALKQILDEHDSKKTIKQESSSALRRDFKIHGAIDSKTGLSFISLVRQINTGLEKGYPDSDILDAIIRAVPTNTGLRNYLEGKQSLTLPAVRQILRAHYKEKSTTELFGQLGQLTQLPTDEAQEFLLRSLELRQKILFTSLEKGADVSYEEDLVNKLFQRSFYTGLRSDMIRSEMKSALEGATVDDEHLIQILSVISLKEEERNHKMNRSRKTVKVSAVELSTPESPKESNKKPVKDGQLTIEVRELRAEIEALKRAMTPENKKSQGGARCCRACQEANRRTCDHCWRYGSSDHFRAGCRQRRPGNGTESSQGGRG